jgi:hypothetical protein
VENKGGYSSLHNRQTHPAGHVQIQSFLAMAQARIDKLEEARRTLADSLALLPNEATTIALIGFQSNWEWRETAMARVLYREAEDLLRDATFPADPFAR